MEYKVTDLAITNVNVYESKKDGTPFITKNGNPFKKVNFKVDMVEAGVDDPSFEGWLSMLDFDGVADNWSDGEKITGTIEKNGDFWNFNLPKLRLTDVLEAVESLEKRVRALESTTEPQGGVSTPSEDNIEGNLPF